MKKGGDLLVNNLLLINAHGEHQEMRDFCSNITIYEQIDEPFLSGRCTIVDGQDFIKNLRLTGQESLTLKLLTPDIDGEFANSVKAGGLYGSIDKTFRIYAISDANRDNSANQLTQSYVLHFIDPMWFECQAKRISQVFHGSYSGILQKILLEYAGFKYLPMCGDIPAVGEIEYLEESSPNNNQFISPNWNINKLIKFCTQNADVENNTSWKNSMFFYQTLAGKYRFESFQRMTTEPEHLKTFVYTGIPDIDYSEIDDINLTYGEDTHDKYPLGQNIPILSVSSPQRVNHMTGVTGGAYAAKMQTYDPVRKVHEDTIYSIKEVFARGSEGHTSTELPVFDNDEPLQIFRLENAHGDYEEPIITQYTNHLAPSKSYDDVIYHRVNMTNAFSDEDKLIDASGNKTIQQQRGQEYRDSSDMERAALLNLLKQNVTRFEIPFRTDLSVGRIGNFILPVPEPGEAPTLNMLHDERYLLSKIVYNINPQKNTGTLVMHGVKDSLGMKIEEFKPLEVPPAEEVEKGEVEVVNPRGSR